MHFSFSSELLILFTNKTRLTSLSSPHLSKQLSLTLAFGKLTTKHRQAVLHFVNGTLLLYGGMADGVCLADTWVRTSDEVLPPASTVVQLGPILLCTRSMSITLATHSNSKLCLVAVLCWLRSRRRVRTGNKSTESNPNTISGSSHWRGNPTD